MFYYYGLLTASAAILWLVYRYAIHYRGTNTAILQPNEKKNASEQEDTLRAYQDIEPLHDFDWEATPPMKLRPFKPKYHLTMGEEAFTLININASVTNRFVSLLQPWRWSLSPTSYKWTTPTSHASSFDAN